MHDDGMQGMLEPFAFQEIEKPFHDAEPCAPFNVRSTIGERA